MSNKLVLQALQTATIAAVTASILPTLPILMKGRDDTPPNNQKYLEVVFIPNNRMGETWGKEKTFQGLFRLVLHWPINDEGAYEPMDVIESIGSYFDKTTPLLNGGLKVNIYQNPNFNADIDGGHETLYPVSILYRCFKP